MLICQYVIPDYCCKCRIAHGLTQWHLDTSQPIRRADDKVNNDFAEFTHIVSESRWNTAVRGKCDTRCQNLEIRFLKDSCVKICQILTLLDYVFSSNG